MTKERIEKELVKVREQLAIMQAKEKDLEEQRKMAEDAEKMKFMGLSSKVCKFFFTPLSAA